MSEHASADREYAPAPSQCAPAYHAAWPYGLRAPAALLSAVTLACFIAAPILDAALTPASEGVKALDLCGSVAFSGAYACFAFRGRRRLGGRRAILLLAFMAAVAVALSLGGSPGWGYLFIYCAACAALVGDERLAVAATGASIALAGLVPALAGGVAGMAYGYVAAAAGTGVGMLMIRGLVARNQELREARAELARLAVARERERFARDLHDLLGHSLSLIALKSQLAGRLLSLGTGDAAREVAEIEQIARGALGEVRQAVGDYRRPTLEVELQGARVALQAAGVALALARAGSPQLAPEVESVLAWGVREAATNVIRHSRAQLLDRRPRRRALGAP